MMFGNLFDMAPMMQSILSHSVGPGVRRYAGTSRMTYPNRDARTPCKRLPAGTPKADLVAAHKVKMARKYGW